jgi:hypothetical protein
VVVEKVLIRKKVRGHPNDVSGHSRENAGATNGCSFGYGRQIARAMGAHYLLAEEIVDWGVIELPL